MFDQIDISSLQSTSTNDFENMYDPLDFGSVEFT